jgi:hypothetical protein
MIASEKVKRLESLLGRVNRNRGLPATHLRLGFETGLRAAPVPSAPTAAPALGLPPSTKDFGDPDAAAISDSAAVLPASVHPHEVVAAQAVVAPEPAFEELAEPALEEPAAELEAAEIEAPAITPSPSLVEAAAVAPAVEEPPVEEVSDASFEADDEPTEMHVISSPEPLPLIAEAQARVEPEPAVLEPAVLEPAVLEPAVLEPAVPEPAVPEPAVPEPAVVEAPTLEVVEAPVVEAPVVEALVVEAPVVEALERDAIEEPSLSTPSIELGDASEAVSLSFESEGAFAEPPAADEVAEVEPWEIESVPPPEERPAVAAAAEDESPVIELSAPSQLDDELVASEPVTHPAPTDPSGARALPLEPFPPDLEAITEPKPAFEVMVDDVVTRPRGDESLSYSPEPSSAQPLASAAVPSETIVEHSTTDIADESTAVSESTADGHAAAAAEPTTPIASAPIMLEVAAETPVESVSLAEPHALSAIPPTKVSMGPPESEDPDAITSKLPRKIAGEPSLGRRRSRPPPFPRLAEVSSTQISEPDSEPPPVAAEPPAAAVVSEPVVSAPVVSAPVVSAPVVSAPVEVPPAVPAVLDLDFEAPPPPEPAQALADAAPSRMVIAPLSTVPSRVQVPAAELIGEIEAMKPASFGDVIEATLSLSLPGE